jgi:predicted dinucleotide-utilizing enzyme
MNCTISAIIFYCYTVCFVVQLGSPIAFSDSSTERQLREVSSTGTHGLYIPSGALWGGEDIRRMADRGTLKVTHLCEIDSSCHVHDVII